MSEAIVCDLDLGSEAGLWHRPTIYNPSVLIGNLLLARLEEFEDEVSSEARVFSLEGSVLRLVDGTPRFRGIQDPYYLGTFRDPVDESRPYHVIGGVAITIDGVTGLITNWQDVNYRYKKSIDEVVQNGWPVPFLRSAPCSKDLRYTQLDDCIAACPRPQGEFGGIGRVGFFRTRDISTLQGDLLRYFANADESTLVPDIFEEDEWGGINQMIPQPDGTIFVVGHKARRIATLGGVMLRYRAFSSVLDPESGKLLYPIEEFDITPHQFGDVTPKRPELDDVVFTGGVSPLNATTALFIGGIKDAAVAMKVIPNPVPGYSQKYTP
ncbi:MAG TPA: DUF1861 family protein [Candidatus Saccharimonadales bacterium]|nr:DUF1861 family protein [Candidatus Saccharimonadales bacterium]